MANRVTIADLAKAAQVSVSTVDRILNKRGPVQRQTEEHVLVVAERIGFHAVPGLRKRLSETAPERTFGFVLNRRDRFLYARLAALLTTATTSSPNIQGRAVIRYLGDLSPDVTAAALMDLGAQCDAVAGVCVDHPWINIAVAELANRGIPFWAMLSDLSAPERAGFVGSNGWKVGRSAGWFMHRLRPQGGNVAVVMGSTRYLGQQEYEAGFRSYLRDARCAFNLLPAYQTEENDALAFDITVDLLRGHRDVTGIFIAGGGVDGIVSALKEHGRRDIAVVSTELSEKTRIYLTEGLIDVGLSHPAEKVASEVVRAMEGCHQKRGGPLIYTVQQEIAISESI